MKPSLLFVSAHLPLPDGTQAGMRCSYHLCKVLSRDFQTHLLCFATDAELPQYSPEPFTIFKSHRIIPVTNCLRALGVLAAPDLPIAVGARNSAAFRRCLSSLISQEKVETVILDHTAMWQYAAQLSEVPMVCGLAHDVLTQLWERRERAATGVLAGLLRAEAKRVRKWEAAALRQLDMVTPFSEKDAALLTELCPHASIFPIQPWFSNLVVTRKQIARCENRSRKNIVYWGALNRKENQDAVRFALEEILPLVRVQFPGVHFFIAGAASERLRRMWSAPGVTVTGFVQDAGELFSQMDIALLPLRLGAGIKIKTLECMSAGLPVITTPVGIEGISAREGTEYLLGRTAEEISARVIELLEDPVARESIGINAQHFVAKTFDSDASSERFSAELISRINS